MVAIILCTYNGGKYLRELLDSIWKQTYQEWIIYVSDDGSADDTLHIVKEYQQAHPDKIVNITDQTHILRKDDANSKRDGQVNGALGACRNFLSTLIAEETNSADYYMFADQDDVWHPDKIEQSVKKMREMEEEAEQVPLLVHCDSRVVDEKLRLIANSYTAYLQMDQQNHRFPHLLLQNIVTGGGTLINRTLRNMVQILPRDAVMHDHWMALIAAAFGKIQYLDARLYDYRQHASNVIGAKKGGMMRETFDRLGFGNGRKKEKDRASQNLYHRLFRQAEEFEKIYQKQISEQVQKDLRYS